MIETLKSVAVCYFLHRCSLFNVQPPAPKALKHTASSELRATTGEGEGDGQGEGDEESAEESAASEPDDNVAPESGDANSPQNSSAAKVKAIQAQHL